MWQESTLQKVARTDLNPPPDPSQEQARDILAQWKAHSHAAETNSQFEFEQASRMADLFKVLSDPTRVNIVQALIRNAEMRVRDIAEEVQASQSSVSHHLRILRHFRLVRAQRAGRDVLYSPNDSHVELLLQVCAEHLSGQ